MNPKIFGRSDSKLFGAVLSLFILLIAPIQAQALSGCIENMTNYWKLDEISGTTFMDSKGGNSAACTGAACPSFTSGKIGRALGFNGVDDAVNVPVGASFNWNSGDSFSIEFWAKTSTAGTAPGTQVIVGRHDSLFQWWVGIWDNGDAAFVLQDKTGNLAMLTGPWVSDGFWHHIVAVRDAINNQIRIYVDGVQRDSQAVSYSAGFDSATTALNIGWINQGSGFHFAGKIDEVALYNRALSDVEIRSHYYIVRGYCDMCSIPIRIMPLGDSITHGVSAHMTDENYVVGYRQKLYNDLTYKGYNVDFVGSLQSGAFALPPFDVHHEGHLGWMAEGGTGGGISPNIYNWLVANPADVILLHIGTNDIPDSADPTKVSRILDNIDLYSEDITVVLSRIIMNEQSTAHAAATIQWNDQVETIAIDRVTDGDKIIRVDQESAVIYPNDYDDTLHPNMTGYNKMANVWFNALKDFLPVCFTPLANIAPLASVTASSENVGTGQLAVKAVDTFVDGWPGDYTKEWATVGQLTGAWIKLSWPQAYDVDRIVLYDRPNSAERITQATLSFSDGSSMIVGPLSNNGSGDVFTFPTKTITWVKMTVNKATGYNIGLAEFEVYKAGSTPNHPPIANAGGDQTKKEGGTVTLNGTASVDPDGDQLTYHWVQLQGTPVILSAPASPTPIFTAPSGLSTPENLVFQLVVNDGEVDSSPDTVTITIIPLTYSNIAPLASVTASSENVGTGQLAVKAVDTFVDFVDYTKEWATVGQLTGAWIKLSWPQAYDVNEIVLYDRPNSAERITQATLSFSDGSSMIVGPLANNGSGNVFTFLSKTITWVKMTVNQATGYNIGLAEFEVYKAGSTPNHPPIANAGVDQTKIEGGTVTLSGTASVDPDGDQLTYHWVQLQGTPVILSAPASPTPFFTAPSGLSTSENLVFQLVVNDGEVDSFPDTVTITIIPLTYSNIAPLASVTASSENVGTGQRAVKAVDTFVDGWPGDYTKEWATVKQLAGAWITLSWPQAYDVDEIVLYDRPNSDDRITQATLSFSDGSSMIVGPLSNNGSGNVFTFPSKTITWVRMTVNQATGYNIGLAEFEVVGSPTQISSSNIAPLASVTASSERVESGQRAVKAVDTFVDGWPGDYTKEWATVKQLAGAWITLSWPQAYDVDEIVLYDRPNSDDWITQATLSFSDGSSMIVGPLANNGSGNVFTFPSKTITWVRMTVNQATGYNIGLSEFEAIGYPSSN